MEPPATQFVQYCETIRLNQLVRELSGINIKAMAEEAVETYIRILQIDSAIFSARARVSEMLSQCVPRQYTFPQRLHTQ